MDKGSVPAEGRASASIQILLYGKCDVPLLFLLRFPFGANRDGHRASDGRLDFGIRAIELERRPGRVRVRDVLRVDGRWRWRLGERACGRKELSGRRRGGKVVGVREENGDRSAQEMESKEGQGARDIRRKLRDGWTMREMDRSR